MGVFISISNYFRSILKLVQDFRQLSLTIVQYWDIFRWDRRICFSLVLKHSCFCRYGLGDLRVAHLKEVKLGERSKTTFWGVSWGSPCRRLMDVAAAFPLADSASGRAEYVSLRHTLHTPQKRDTNMGGTAFNSTYV